MKSKTPQIIGIIQARMDSSRFPGKVLEEIDGRPMLGWVIERASRSQLLNGIAIATTTDNSDDAIVKYCQDNGYQCFRGSIYDVLDRYYQAALHFKAHVIVRLTADCPFIDPVEIDRVINLLLTADIDFATNRLPPPAKRTFPIGLDTEVCTFSALQRAWQEADMPHQREHVMPYLYDQNNHFRIKVLNHDPDFGHIRITVDTAKDLELIRQIKSYFPNRDDFSWKEIVDVLQNNPNLTAINADVHHKSGLDIDNRIPNSS